MIGDAIHVCAAFNSIVRLADSLGFAIPSAAAFDRMADRLLARGYA